MSATPQKKTLSAAPAPTFMGRVSNALNTTAGRIGLHVAGFCVAAVLFVKFGDKVKSPSDAVSNFAREVERQQFAALRETLAAGATA